MLLTLGSRRSSRGGDNQVLAEVACVFDPVPVYLQDLPPHFDANAPFWLFQSAARRLL